MLEFEPKKRISWDSIFNHPLINLSKKKIIYKILIIIKLLLNIYNILNFIKNKKRKIKVR